MPIIDLTAIAIFIKNLFVKVGSLALIYGIKAATWTFIISSFLLAGNLVVKLYNWLHDFKDAFDGTTSTGVAIDLAKASGVLSALSDLFSVFLLILTVFISYQISVYLKQFALAVNKEAQDIAMLINS